MTVYQFPVRGNSCTTGGFTIVELITVIALLAVLSMVAISRSVKPGDFDVALVNGFVTESLRFAQRQAMHRQDGDVEVSLAGASGQWQVQIDVGAAAVHVDATDRGGTEVLADGLSLDDGPLIMRYAGSGWVTSASVGGTALTATDGIDLQVNAGTSRQLCVYPNGYVVDGACS